MTLRSKIKQNAFRVLHRNWWKAIGILLIILALQLVVTALENAVVAFAGIAAPTISANETDAAVASAVLSYYTARLPFDLIFTVILLLLTTPLLLGQTEWYWNLDQKPGGVEGIFVWYGTPRLFFKSLWLLVSIVLRLLPWVTLLFILPCLLCFGAYSFLNDANTTIVMAAALAAWLGFALMLAGYLLLALVGARYFLAPYLLVEDNTRRVSECVRDSVRQTRGERWHIVVFWLSFLPWLILCLFIFPQFFVLPYFMAASAIYAKYLCYNARIRERGGPDAARTIEFGPGGGTPKQ